MIKFSVSDSLKQESPFDVECPAEALTAEAYARSEGGKLVFCGKEPEENGWLAFSWVDTGKRIHHCRIKRKGY